VAAGVLASGSTTTNRIAPTSMSIAPNRRGIFDIGDVGMSSIISMLKIIC
jgi:hypothetical protein